MLVHDVRGRVFDCAQLPRRIVSLVPSLTEALFGFGVGERVVGVTDYCIHPAEGVTTKTRVGGTKNPRVDLIVSLAPDLVIANMEENRKSDVTALEAHGIPVYVTFPRTVRTVIQELGDLATLLGSEGGTTLASSLERAVARVETRSPALRVFVAIWRDPWMTANGDTYVGDLIKTCRGENIFHTRERRYPLAADLGQAPARPIRDADTRYPRVSIEEVAAGRPQVILLPDEPYRFGERDAQELRETPGLQEARVYLVDGTMLTWAGIRTARAIEMLSRLLNSD